MTKKGLTPDSDTPYYAFSPHPGWRFLVLDPYDISTCGRPVGHPKEVEAWKLLEANNPNDLRGNSDWQAGLVGPARRWVPFNGALSVSQLAWIQGELEMATACGDRVIVLTHVPMQPNACSPGTLLWNYEEVLSLLESAGCVVAVLTGHDHDGGYARGRTGIHHVTFHSPLEVAPPGGSHATVTVYADRLQVDGNGAQASFTLPFDPATEPRGS